MEDEAVKGFPEPASSVPAHCELEIAHVLFLDLVGYSLLPMERQREFLEELQGIVHACRRVRDAGSSGEIVSLPTGDGMALVFFRDPVAPAQCSWEIATALAGRPHLKLRMGINSGPVYHVTDVNAHHNVAGGGINLAQRVMDCGDAGHILVSQSSAEVLLQIEQWAPHLTRLGLYTVKHGVELCLYSLAGDGWGNRERPKKLAHAPGPPRVARRSAIAAGVAALAGAGGYWAFRGGESAAAPSIAVLPFADMSAERNQAYFSDGLAEELLDNLAKIPGLRVVGRASSFQFRDSAADLRSIGEKLRVSTVLEGSVRRQGNRARVGVQLIKVPDGFHLWSDIFDRDLRDILAVQEDIARAVAGALKVELLGGRTQAASPPPIDPQAYNDYLQGRYFYERANRENLERAVGYFQSALARQPDYAAAWLGLGEARISQADGGYVDVSSGYSTGGEALEHARRLDERLAEAHAALGWLRISQRWDWDGAEEPIRRALALEPNNVQVIRYAARLARSRGRWQEAVALNERGVAIDPLSSRIFHNLGLAYYYGGRAAEAAQAVRKALELNPEMAIAHLTLTKVHLAAGKPKDALAEALREKHPAYRLLALAIAYFALDRRAESDTALGELVAGYAAEDALQIAEAYAFRAEAGKALEWLERARAQRDPGFSELKGDPLLKNLETDPRYQRLLRTVGL